MKTSKNLWIFDTWRLVSSNRTMIVTNDFSLLLFKTQKVENILAQNFFLFLCFIFSWEQTLRFRFENLLNFIWKFSLVFLNNLKIFENLKYSNLKIWWHTDIQEPPGNDSNLAILIFQIKFLFMTFLIVSNSFTGLFIKMLIYLTNKNVLSAH